MSRALAMPQTQSEPMSAMNLTPFIDVLLVLLVMLIITIPLQTHKLAVDLPQGGTPTQQAEPHTLALDAAGGAWWDGRRVTDPQLRSLLGAVGSDSGALKMQTDPETRYDRFDRVLAMVKHSGITRLGFVGDGALQP